MGPLEDLMDGQSILWIKKMVVDFTLSHPPQKQIKEWKLIHWLGDNNGIVLRYNESSREGDNQEPENSIYIKKEVIPDLIVALQKYISDIK